MALTHTIMTPLYNAALGIGAALKIQQGGHSTVLTHQQGSNLYTNFNSNVRLPFVWNGNVFLPMGGLVNTTGWAKYNPILDKLTWAFYSVYNMRHIPVFDRVGYLYTSDQGWGYGPEDRRAQVGSVSMGTFDHAISGSDVAVIETSTNNMCVWAYPFTSPFSTVGASLPDSTCRRVCELGGKFYTVWIDDVAGELKLYRYDAGALTLVGTSSAHSGLADYDSTVSSSQALFKFNNKLWLACTNTVVSNQIMRLFEINPTTGASIEQNGYLPAAWTAVTGVTTHRVMEVPDYISTNEQMFLIRYSYGGAGWECYEFKEGSFVLVDTGTDYLLGGGAVIFDPDARGAQIKSAADSVPSSYVRCEIEVFDLKSNGNVDIDPRYRWDSAESPPYPQCTGKAPNNVVTNLASAPVLSTLPDLDDDFGDAVLNEELWEHVTVAFFGASYPSWRDYGHGYLQGLLMGTPATETNGAIRFGRAGDTVESYQGVGIRSKSRIDGAFQIDFVTTDINQLAATAGPSHIVFAFVRVAVNEGFGFFLYNKAPGGPYVRGFTLNPDGFFTPSGSEYSCPNGTVVRIVRDALGNWTLTNDPGGSANDITPPGAPTITDQVEVVMGARSVSSGWVSPTCPIGQEPGFADFAVSGAGSPGLYQGGVKHTFDWDHVADLSAGQNGSAELFVDTQRT